MFALLTVCPIVQISAISVRKGNVSMRKRERGFNGEVLNIENKKGNLNQIEAKNAYLFQF